MKKTHTDVSCNVSNCSYEKEGKCTLKELNIRSEGRGDRCMNSSSTLCDSFKSRENTSSLDYEFASDFDLEKDFVFENKKKEAMILE